MFFLPQVPCFPGVSGTQVTTGQDSVTAPSHMALSPPGIRCHHELQEGGDGQVDRETGY